MQSIKYNKMKNAEIKLETENHFEILGFRYSAIPYAREKANIPPKNVPAAILWGPKPGAIGNTAKKNTPIADIIAGISAMRLNNLIPPFCSR